MELLAKQIRLEVLKMLSNLGFGHYGGSLSIVETLAVLYGKQMRYDPHKPKDPNRDYLVLSKGHAGPALYATLAIKGFFPMESLLTLNQNGTKLPSHADCNLTPGIDMTTGSLGQGISSAAGIAYYLQAKGKSNKVFCIVGDGELNEGQCWEAFQFIAHHQLRNLLVLIDDNKKQLDGYTREICNPFDYVEKMKAFGFDAVKVDGSNIRSIDDAISRSYRVEGPCAIILDTIKGQGVKYLENKQDNHHIRPSQEDQIAIDTAISILEEEISNGNA